MQCQGVTTPGYRCSRKAQINSNFCWQHQNQESKLDQEAKSIASQSLILQALQPSILSNINLYSGNTSNINNILKDDLNKKKILGNWLRQIGVQTPIGDVKSSDLKILWTLYQKRVDNLPMPDLLAKAIENGLDKYLFYSRKFEYKGNLGVLAEYQISNIFTEGQIIFINEQLQDFITLNKVRKGDVVHLSEMGDYRNEGSLVYNGQQLIDLNYDLDEYGSLPEEIQINDFPIVQYFIQSITHNNLVNFNTNGSELQYLSEYKGKESIVYQYVTIGKSPGYIIWSISEPIHNDSFWEGVLPFTVGQEGLEDFLDYTSQDFEEYHNKLVKNYNPFKELFDFLNRSY